MSYPNSFQPPPDHQSGWSRSDRIALLALIISAAAVYKSFTDDPIRKQLEHSPRIHAAVAETYFRGGCHYTLRVWNVGTLPAKNVKIALSAFSGVQFPTKPGDITLNPLSPNKTSRDDHSIILSLERSLGKDQSVTCIIKNLKLDSEMNGPCLDARSYNDDEGESTVKSYEQFDVVPTTYTSKVIELPAANEPEPKRMIGELPPR